MSCVYSLLSSGRSLPETFQTVFVRPLHGQTGNTSKTKVCDFFFRPEAFLDTSFL